MKYFEWEAAVIEAVADAMAISHSDASGIVEAQPFYMQQSWGKGIGRPSPRSRKQQRVSELKKTRPMQLVGKLPRTNHQQ